MKNKSLLIFVLGLCLISLSACNSSNNKEEKTNSNDLSLTPTASVEENHPEPGVEKGIENNPLSGKKDELTLNDKLNSQPSGIKMYKLITPNDFAPIYLELKPDLSFAMDFNYCQGVSHGTGTYSVENGLYFLKIENSSDMPELKTVKLEFKQISDTELKLSSEAYRLVKEEKIYFCAPFSDPNHQFDGAEYNVYKLVE